MNGTTRVGLVLTLVGLMVALCFPGLTGADGGRANVIRGEKCTIRLAELEEGAHVTTTDTQSVETPSGNVTMVCRAHLPDGLDAPGRAVRTRGEECDTPLGRTTDTEKVITPGGRVRLTCRVKHKPPPPAIGWAVGEAPGPGGYGVIIHTTDGGQTWVRQGTAEEIPDVSLGIVSAIDADNAWVVGDQGTILRTRDGGQSWELQDVPAEVSEAELAGVHAVDRKTAWAAGTLPGAESQGVILHTSDGGQAWTQQGQNTVPKSTHLEGVYASDADHAWTVGSVYGQGTEKKIVLRTTNGGNTWEVVPWAWHGAFDDGHFIDIHGVDTDTVWTVGTGMAAHTTDGGLTWIDQTADGMPPMLDVNGVFAVDRSTIWAVQDYGSIFRSNNGGKHWVTQEVPDHVKNDFIMRISAVDKRTAWAVSVYQGDSPGHVLHTADAGHTWTVQNTPIQTDWNGVSFVR